MKSNLLAGVGVQVITPAVGGRLLGYRPDVYSKSVNDDLTATALAIVSGNQKILVISLTICLIEVNLADEIRGLISAATGIPATHILLSATHTHSGPNTGANMHVSAPDDFRNKQHSICSVHV